MDSIYIGDGVYATHDRALGRLILTTGHHEVAHADNVVYIELSDFRNLLKWLEYIKAI